MPRNHHPGASTLRNRNRITNKTRLKIVQDNIEADALLIPDEDEEKNRLTNLVAGVDAEDANEHHLQEVLNASHRLQSSITRSSRAGDKPAPPVPQAFIPTPDSTGVVDNYDHLYPANRWKDPNSYVFTSSTVEEAIKDGIADGFTYYMDERDKEWLDKNNEEARGEGTSAQGAVSTATATGGARASRSAKAKGKEPETSQPVVISEDEFELVMGVFEKVTHEKTEFLHHGLETGMLFPAFTEYQETFSAPLPPSMFASYSVPSWIPSPQLLSRMARAIYPYWKERRIERGGHRIIPVLNFDESDTLNESYICFRRREIKAVRKTRASQATSSDKLARLHLELSYPLELAKLVLSREQRKQESAKQAQELWEKRLAFVNLKRKYPTLGDKADEELLVDKERPSKKQEIAARIPGSLRIKTQETPIPNARPEVAMQPRERYKKLREKVESQLAAQKEQDLPWDDQIDNAYQMPFVPYTSRLFKFVPPSGAPSWPLSDSDKSEAESTQRNPRAVRMRYGRGGRMLVDRRDWVPPPLAYRQRRHSDSDDDMKVDDPEEDDRRRRLEERWKYDMDDGPVIGPQGLDEHDRILVDDYDPKYLRHTMTLLADPDQHALLTDNSIEVSAGEGGRHMMVVPYRLGLAQPMMRRDAPGAIRPFHPNLGTIMPGVPSISMGGGATPVSVSQQLKKMPPPNGIPQQMRISSNGGMRPPVGVTVSTNMQPSNVPSSQSSPTQPLPIPQHSPPNGASGSRPAINMPHIDIMKQPEMNAHSALSNGGVPIQHPDESSNTQDVSVNGSPFRPTSQNQHQVQAAPNGFHLTPMSNRAAAALAVTAPNYNQFQNVQNAQQQHTALNMQQMQQLKSAFANMQNPQNMQGQQDLAMMQASIGRNLAANYIMGQNGSSVNLHLPNTANGMNLKLPPSRQMQWANIGQSMQQRPPSAMNGMDNQGMRGMSSSPTLGQAVPVRSPSVNGMRNTGMRSTSGHMLGPNGQLSISPTLQHSPSPMSQGISQAQSPPRLPMTPTMPMTSPSLQHQQPIGSSKSGY